MNNYYTLIYLISELKENILAGKLLFAISPHKHVLECYVETKTTTFRIIFSTKPSETVLFYDDYRPPKKRNVVEFFKPLEGQKIVNITLAKHDRLVYFHFDGGQHLLFKLFGNNANALLVKDATIRDAFKHPERIIGQQPPSVNAPTFGQAVSFKASPKRRISRLNPLLPRKLLPPLINQHDVGSMSPEACKVFTQRITDALLYDAHPRVLSSGVVCLWSQKILDLPTEESFNSVNACVRHAYRNAVHLRRLHQKKQRLLNVLQRLHKKKLARLRQLKKADKQLERADRYEKYGHLLMAHTHEKVETGAKMFKVNDFYNQNQPIQIPIKEGGSIVDNAQQYYEKAQASRKAYENDQQQLPLIKKQKRELAALLGELEAINRLWTLNKWVKKNKKTLESWGYGTNSGEQARSPFRKFEAGKYEIWVGKNAKSNDQLTSRAHKEDVWLHARGMAGSHTVIRMGNQKEYPPQKVLLQAASYAAYYSKAKGMRTAPVMYTKCKYVRKPKGAAAGAVVVEREQVVMVPPLKPG